MYFNRDAISREEAQAKLAAINVEPKVVDKKVVAAHGFILARDIFAPFPMPAFRRSGYDGFGILSEDDHDFPQEFTVLDTVGAGDVLQEKMVSGQAVRIMTGAKVPDEVGKVIMLEQTETISSGRMRILASGLSDNISKIGEECQKGERVLSKGSILNAGALSLLASFGLTEISVFEKPKVGILTTGTELLKADEPYQEGKIYNSNGILLENLVKENGGEVVSSETVTDQLADTLNLLSALTEKCDLILSSGGVSVGDFDFMAEAAQSARSHLLFNKLAMRPGSPTTAFVFNDTPVIALSGNPGACFTGFYLFAEPLIQRFQAHPSRVTKAKAPLAHAYTRPSEFDKYIRAVVSDDGKARQIGSDKSSVKVNLHLTTTFFKVPSSTSLKVGDEVEIWKLP